VDKELREDLFYRLNAVSIRLPALRERPDDIAQLAQAFADRVYKMSPGVKFSAEALEALKSYAWPGNIRELENAVVHASSICDGVIRLKDLPPGVRERDGKQSLESKGLEPQAESGVTADWPSLSELEGRYLVRVLNHTHGNKQAAARVMQVDRKTLDRMIKRHGVQGETVYDGSVAVRKVPQLAKKHSVNSIGPGHRVQRLNSGMLASSLL
jgi:two-component system, NtrC family, response regulator AtoC